ncbi:MAG: hypothetical protein ACRDE5_11445, partial [Ginsengibacter sp.]
MKIILLLLLILIECNEVVTAQKNSTDTTDKPYITPFGKPVRNITTAKIDSKGGMIKSENGKLEVIFPADALDAETTVSVQPIHNELTEDDEGAYQLEPSGMIFKKPVQLIFHYTDTNDNADLKAIGWQDDKGQWHHLKKIVTDTIQKTVSCFAHHFSRWAKFDMIFLYPKNATVKVNKQQPLFVQSFQDLLDAIHNDNVRAANEAIQGDEDLASPDLKILPNYYTDEWTVNGNANGTPEDGFVTKQDNRNAVYKAPATVPNNNPVAVSVQIYSDKKTRKLLLTSNITVIGGKYHFTYIHIDEGDGCFALVDSSSCIVNLDTDNPSITNIINYPPWSDWPNCSKSCRTEWTNKETVKGLVEINGLASSVITPPRTGSGPTNIYIALVPAMGSTASA